MTLSKTRPKTQTKIIEFENDSSGTEQWQTLWSNAVTNTEQLFKLLDLDPTLIPEAQRASAEFPLKVPHPFLEKMRPSDPLDPLLLQVLPSGREIEVVPGYSKDPLQEAEFTPAPGLLHKYHGRALLIVSPSCVVNCRYCFRRHFPYQAHQNNAGQWQQALDYINQTPSITEIILSGGDPLAINNKRLHQLIQHLDAIPHLKRLRIHTRFPVMIPQRIDSPLVQMLSQSRLQKVMVIHANHGNEIDQKLGKALGQLSAIDVTLLNQSVLLKGVNDSVESLLKLSENLFDYNILPYYLHLLDPVAGAAHFNVPQHKAIQLVNQLRAQLPGYLVPTLVQEQAFQPNKVPIEGPPDPGKMGRES
ncbi:MAG: EF-P beta-lysylation protein EpmB [Pseudomonadales bacterium]|nr:EF-P beta-lysylation protein EpmB [Pseudomonadales bacterium]